MLRTPGGPATPGGAAPNAGESEFQAAICHFTSLNPLATQSQRGLGLTEVFRSHLDAARAKLRHEFASTASVASDLAALRRRIEELESAVAAGPIEADGGKRKRRKSAKETTVVKIPEGLNKVMRDQLIEWCSDVSTGEDDGVTQLKDLPFDVPEGIEPGELC